MIREPLSVSPEVTEGAAGVAAGSDAGIRIPSSDVKVDGFVERQSSLKKFRKWRAAPPAGRLSAGQRLGDAVCFRRR